MATRPRRLPAAVRLSTRSSMTSRSTAADGASGAPARRSRAGDARSRRLGRRPPRPARRSPPRRAPTPPSRSPSTSLHARRQAGVEDRPRVRAEEDDGRDGQWPLHPPVPRVHGVTVEPICHDATRVSPSHPARGRRRVPHPGVCLHQPDHPAAGVLRPLVPLGGRALAAAARPGPAGRRRHARGRTGRPAVRLGGAAPCRAAGHGAHRPGGHAGPERGRLRGGRRRLRRDARRHRRGDQHAGRRPRARVRAADPAVVPRRLDASADCSPPRLRSPPRTSTCAGWPSSPSCRSWRSPRRTSPTSAPAPRRPTCPVSRCRGDRSCWSGRPSCSSTWSTRRRSPGDRPTSTTRSTRRPTWSPWPRSPTCWRAASSGSRATTSYAATARSACCARARWSPPPPWRSSSSHRRGRSPCWVSSSSAGASRSWRP